jgi:hypothetical protein
MIMAGFIHSLFWNFVSHTYKWWPDTLWLKMIYRTRFKRSLNFDVPKSFNEKLNWLKVYDRNPLYTKLANKYEVKEYVRNKIGEEYVVPCYGVWDDFDDIDFSILPVQFVLKCTHDSGGMCICKDKSTLNKEEAKNKLEKTLKNNFFWWTREWPYKNVKPRILADMLLDDHTGKVLRDYKFWCFNGTPKYMYCTVKSDDIYENFYDMDFQPVAINHGFKRNVPEFEKPQCFDLMKSLATSLSEGIPFVRIDFFYVEGKVYFGEFTFYDWAGLRPFADYGQDLELGELIALPK